jgi:uncharacterized membrane protein YkvA (DUF1232 family)
MWKRLTLYWTLFRGDARQLWFALRHPDAPLWLKVGAALIVLFAISPIETIPFLGQLDVMIVVPLAIRFLLKRLPPEIAQATAARR